MCTTLHPVVLLSGHKEYMRKWNGKHTLSLEAWVCELQGKIAAKRCSSRKITAPVSIGKFSRRSRRAHLTIDP